MTELTEQHEDSAGRSVLHQHTRPAHIRIVFGPCAVAVYEIQAAGAVIGREPSTSADQLCIADSRISRQHIRIEHAAGSWKLTDLGSKNGGYLDGHSFAPHAQERLGDGTLIRLGGSLLVFRTSPALDDGASELGAFPGVSPIAADVRRRIATLALASGHVLILGETGTGKERVARAFADHRTAAPFIAQNCGELKKELSRSELFGHMHNAFTGASQRKLGLVHAASNGVLFLDEIGELSLEVQAELLRFLEDGTYRPVGGEQVVRSTARIVAATNVALDQAVANRTFRRDLLARLRASNAPLELPPLRERREDIPQWTRLFLREADCPVGDGIEEIWTVGALECLMLFPWLENLRELRRVVRELTRDNETFPCAAERLPEVIQQHRNALRGTPESPVLHEPPNAAIAPGDPSREDIEAAIRQTKGNMASAAKLLRIERTKLYRLCKQNGIPFVEHRPAPQQQQAEEEE